MRLSRRSTALVAGAALFLALAVSTALHAPSRGAARRQGEINSRQAIALAERLWQGIFPESAGVNIAAEEMRTFSRDGKPVRHWAVQCDDARGVGCLFRIDADTGELLYVSVLGRPARFALAKPCPAGQAMILSREWLESYAAAPGARWMSAAKPRLAQSRWITRWSSGGRNAIVSINGLTGELVTLKVMAA